MSHDLSSAFAKTYSVASYDVGPDHRASVTAVLRYLHDGAQAHAAGQGFGYVDLLAARRAWALVALDLRLGERPRGGGALATYTTVSRATGPLVWRDYVATAAAPGAAGRSAAGRSAAGRSAAGRSAAGRSAAGKAAADGSAAGEIASDGAAAGGSAAGGDAAATNNRVVAEGQSLWALIDLDTRTTAKPSPALRATLSRVAAPLQTRIDGLRRLPRREAPARHAARIALTHDCDFNGHLNNVVAAGWLLDAAYAVWGAARSHAGEAPGAHADLRADEAELPLVPPLRRLWLTYHHEVVCGEEVAVGYAVEAGGVYVELLGGGGERLAVSGWCELGHVR